MGKQVLRSGTSVAANFREASIARSNPEFTAKLGVFAQVLDETMLWRELLVESGTVKADLLHPLRDEAEELLKITVASFRKTKARH